MSNLPKIPIARPCLTHDEKLAENVTRIVTSGALTKGRWLREFENKAAEYLGVQHAIAVSSGTTGLMLAYRALELQGEAIVPSFTFMATASALVWARVRPVFVDSEFHTKNIDPEAITKQITPHTTAIVAVHNFGNPAPIGELQEIANRHNLKLIFDAAHAFGATYQHQPIGSQGDVQVFSLSPTKLVVAGEGGIIATNCGDLAKRLRLAREYGNDGTYDSVLVGLNGRLPEISALLAIESLRGLNSAVENRNAYAAFYQRELRKLPGIGFQEVRSGDGSAYKDFVITIDEDQFGLSRDELMAALAAENIETRSYYNPPVHLQTSYRRFAGHDLHVTERLARQCLSLPMWSQMETGILERICATIEGIQRTCEETRDRHAGGAPATISVQPHGADDATADSANECEFVAGM
jgi:dTDP-4-amino-4,6-dideoxygalactose transaminase